jgi:hypothetical protein
VKESYSISDLMQVTVPDLIEQRRLMEQDQKTLPLSQADSDEHSPRSSQGEQNPFSLPLTLGKGQAA